jgi:hypothetical protein
MYSNPSNSEKHSSDGHEDDADDQHWDVDLFLCLGFHDFGKWV